MTYDESIKRLHDIVQHLESGQVVGMEEYTKLANEAKELIASCRKQLTLLDEQIQQIIDD